jgi:hypothetical protein
VKQRRLTDVRALLGTPEFTEWWGQLTAARAALRDAAARYDELLAQTTLMEFRAELTQKNAIDTLYRAGEHEDTAANMLFEATDLENKSFKGVGEFEEQRFRASETWYRLGAAEKKRDEARDKKVPDSELRSADRALQLVQEEYERENARKLRLWDEVERLWARSAEVSLLVAEERALGKKVRKEAEGLFALAEERKKRSKELKGETDACATAVEGAKAKVSALLSVAREKFGCATGTDFLYFRMKDDQRLAYCVALVEDRDGYNVEVKPLGVYQVDRQRGVAFLEPARASTPSLEEGDRRFEDYFLKGRKGEVRAS